MRHEKLKQTMEMAETYCRLAQTIHFTCLLHQPIHIGLDTQARKLHQVLLMILNVCTAHEVILRRHKYMLKKMLNC